MTARTRASTLLLLVVCLVAAQTWVVSMRSPARSGQAVAASLQSREPGALDRGLVFHPSYPVPLRRLLLNDLQWLGTLGALPMAEQWGPAMGFGETPPTGAALLAWILNRARVIHGFAWCPSRDHVVISDANPKWPASLYRKGGECTLTGNELHYAGLTPHERFQGDAFYAGEQDGVVIGERVVVFDTRFGANTIAMTTNEKYTADTIRSRIKRLTTLVHEASHIRMGANWEHSNHARCASFVDPSSNEKYPIFGYLSAPKSSDCDGGLAKPYALEGYIARSLGAACKSCSFEDDLDNAWFVMDRFYYVVLPLRKQTIPKPALAELVPSGHGRSIGWVPVREYFDAVTALIALELRSPGGCAVCKTALPHVTKAKALIASVARAEGHSEDWSSAPKAGWREAIDEASGLAWVTAAKSASATDYNVPLTFAIPCKQLSRGCVVH